MMVYGTGPHADVLIAGTSSIPDQHQAQEPGPGHGATGEGDPVVQLADAEVGCWPTVRVRRDGRVWWG